MEQAVWTRVDAGQGTPLDMLAARFVRHRFAPHTHEEFASVQDSNPPRPGR